MSIPKIATGGVITGFRHDGQTYVHIAGDPVKTLPDGREYTDRITPLDQDGNPRD